MHLRVPLIAMTLVAFASAQNQLAVTPVNTGPYTWVPPPGDSACFFDLTVNTTITLQGLETASWTHPDDTMQVEVYLTTPGTTTFIGNMQNAALWQLVGVSDSAVVSATDRRTMCFPGGITIQPGTYGACFRSIGACIGFFQNSAAPAVLQVFSNAEMTFTGGNVQYAPFVTAPQAIAFCWSGTIYYSNGANTEVCATDKKFGLGCNMTNGSWYQQWMSPAASSAALNGKSLSMIFTGNGYAVTSPGTSAWIPPSLTAALLPASNNVETVVPLPTGSTFTYPGGSTPSLNVHANGYVSIGPNATVPLGWNYFPSPASLLGANNPIYAGCWKDFASNELNSGRVKHEAVGNLYVITWDGVEAFPGSTTAQTPNPSTFQMQFDMITGDVHYIWQSITAIGGGQYYDAVLIGYSPGGPSVDVGPIDINASPFPGFAVFQPEIPGLTLDSTSPPVLGGLVNLTTSNPNTPFNFGANFISYQTFAPPYIDLGFLGAPGCQYLMDINNGFYSVITDLVPGFMTHTVAVPNNPGLLGFTGGSQSIWLDNPPQNAFGITWSNGIELTIGTFGL